MVPLVRKTWSGIEFEGAPISRVLTEKDLRPRVVLLLWFQNAGFHKRYFISPFHNSMLCGLCYGVCLEQLGKTKHSGKYKIRFAGSWVCVSAPKATANFSSARLCIVAVGRFRPVCGGSVARVAFPLGKNTRSDLMVRGFAFPRPRPQLILVRRACALSPSGVSAPCAAALSRASRFRFARLRA